MHMLAYDAMSLILHDLCVLFWTTVIFLVFWFLMGKFAFTPIVTAIKDREKSIDDALSAADKAKSEMMQLQSDNAALLKEAKEESAKILKEAKDVKESVIADAHNKAKEEAAKIIAAAKVEIEAQKKAALAEVKNEVSKLSLDIAQKVLGRELETAKDQQSYINTLVDKLN